MYIITRKEFFVTLSKNLSLTATVAYSETKFLVPMSRGIYSTMAKDCRMGPPAFVAWWAGNTILC